MNQYFIAFESGENFSMAITLGAKNKYQAFIKGVEFFKNDQLVPETMKQKINRKTVSVVRRYKKEKK